MASVAKVFATLATPAFAAIIVSVAHYPIMLRGEKVLAVVVGGGDVGRRRVASLLEAAVKVRVIEPAEGEWPANVEHVKEKYAAKHLAGAHLVFACTNDPSLNEQIAADGRAAGALINRADSPEDSDFTCPATWRGDDIILAVSTARGAPSLAATIRDELAAAIPSHMDEFAQAVGQLRDKLKNAVAGSNKRSAILKRLAGPEAFAHFRAGGKKSLARWIDTLIQPEKKE